MTSTPNETGNNTENEGEDFPTNPIPANADTDDNAGDNSGDDSSSEHV